MKRCNRVCLFLRQSQPPSGGCVLKQRLDFLLDLLGNQPPSGGCVLKHRVNRMCLKRLIQPPSGGCVLKLFLLDFPLRKNNQPPSGGCVLKQPTFPIFGHKNDPAAFRRLCVETRSITRTNSNNFSSRLQAAVC